MGNEILQLELRYNYIFNHSRTKENESPFSFMYRISAFP